MNNYKIEFEKIIDEILNNSEFQKRKNYRHHGDESVYDHSLKVAKYSYIIARIFFLDSQAAAIGGLLHDFYKEPWQDSKKVHKKINEMHGFVHAKEAYENSCKYFPDLMNNKIKDIITKHMFPLNITPPLYLESWIITIVDKAVSLNVLFDFKNLPKYLGIRK